MKVADPYRRRTMEIHQSQFIAEFQKAQNSIVSNYKKETKRIADQADEYISRKYTQNQSSSVNTELFYQDMPESQESNFSFRMPMWKNELIEEDQSTYNETKNMSNIVQKNVRILQAMEEKDDFDYDQEKQDEELKKSLKKLGLTQEDLKGDEHDYEKERENWQVMNGFEDKPIEQIVQETNKKMAQVLSKRKPAQEEEEYESQQYQMTDYSSNSSSNQNDYSVIMRQPTSEIKQQISSQDSIGSIRPATKVTFLSMPYKMSDNLTLSPKKQKSKRVYLGSKKIPRWAEDLDKISQQVIDQRNSGNFITNLIYGLCMIEKMNSKLFFQKYDRKIKSAVRGSSAKWKKYPDIGFTT